MDSFRSDHEETIYELEGLLCIEDDKNKKIVLFKKITDRSTDAQNLQRHAVKWRGMRR